MKPYRYVFIIKTTYDCNLRCRYCYESDRQPSEKMNFSTLSSLISKIGKYAVRTQNAAEFIWHGGEPLLAGIDFYKKAVQLQKDVEGNFDYINSIQTNGILLDNNFADFFNENKFFVGISIDGPPTIHNSQRIGQSKKDNYREVYSALVRMDERGNRPGALAVFTRKTLEYIDEFYEYFRDRSLSVKLNPLIKDGRAKSKDGAHLHITPEEYGYGLIYLFNRWVKEPELTFTINPLYNYIRSIISSKVYECNQSGSCFNYFKIFPNGNVSLCGFQPYKNNILGNINNIDLELIINSSIRENYIKIKSSIKNSCGSCEYFGICNGGCTNSTYNRLGSLLKSDYWCESKKMIFKHIENHVNNTKIIILNQRGSE